MDCYTIKIIDDDGYIYHYRVSREADGCENGAYVRTRDLIATLVSGASGAWRLSPERPLQLAA
jgi:hypothetical protein